ncbi:hypothetical protein AB0K00_57025 [Dactylosporangium sp. NPDC049525]|uniref:hypothetical protein n=1 Tax=Dactylosporangium sp. NPDC049525 TaxID=3154730 RepID=UPI00341D52F3
MTVCAAPYSPEEVNGDAVGGVTHWITTSPLVSASPLPAVFIAWPSPADFSSTAA